MGDCLVQCPFDPAHVCKRSRIQKHLINCRKNHPNTKKVPCPFNASEYIDPCELPKHLQLCKSAKLVEASSYIIDDKSSNYIDAPFTLKDASHMIGNDCFIDEDEQILERSISQMSINSIGSVSKTSVSSKMSFGRPVSGPNTKIISVTPLGGRESHASSILRSSGRGSAMAQAMAIMQNIDESDNSAFNYNNQNSQKKIMKPISTEELQSSVDLIKSGGSFHSNSEENNSFKAIFQDCDDEASMNDKISVCGSASTINENSTNSKNEINFVSSLTFLSSKGDENKSPHFELTNSGTESVESVLHSALNSSNSIRNYSEAQLDEDDSLSCASEFSVATSLVSSIAQENLLETEKIVKNIGRKYSKNNFHSTNKPFPNHTETYLMNSFRKVKEKPPTLGRGALIVEAWARDDQDFRSSFLANKPRLPYCLKSTENKLSTCDNELSPKPVSRGRGLLMKLLVTEPSEPRVGQSRNKSLSNGINLNLNQNINEGKSFSEISNSKFNEVYNSLREFSPDTFLINSSQRTSKSRTPSCLNHIPVSVNSGSESSLNVTRSTQTSSCVFNSSDSKSVVSSNSSTHIKQSVGLAAKLSNIQHDSLKNANANILNTSKQRGLKSNQEFNNISKQFSVKDRSDAVVKDDSKSNVLHLSKQYDKKSNQICNNNNKQAILKDKSDTVLIVDSEFHMFNTFKQRGNKRNHKFNKISKQFNTQDKSDAMVKLEVKQENKTLASHTIVANKDTTESLAFKHELSNLDESTNNNIKEFFEMFSSSKTTNFKRINPHYTRDTNLNVNFKKRMCENRNPKWTSRIKNPSYPNHHLTKNHLQAVNQNGPISLKSCTNGEEKHQKCHSDKKVNQDSFALSDNFFLTSNTAFRTLHEPQKPLISGRYDNLYGSSYKFITGNMNIQNNSTSYFMKRSNRHKKVNHQKQVKKLGSCDQNIIRDLTNYNPNVNTSLESSSNTKSPSANGYLISRQGETSTSKVHINNSLKAHKENMPKSMSLTSHSLIRLKDKSKASFTNLTSSIETNLKVEKMKKEDTKHLKHHNSVTTMLVKNDNESDNIMQSRNFIKSKNLNVQPKNKLQHINFTNFMEKKNTMSSGYKVTDNHNQSTVISKSSFDTRDINACNDKLTGNTLKQNKLNSNTHKNMQLRPMSNLSFLKCDHSRFKPKDCINNHRFSLPMKHTSMSDGRNSGRYVRFNLPSHSLGSMTNRKQSLPYTPTAFQRRNFYPSLHSRQNTDYMSRGRGTF